VAEGFAVLPITLAHVQAYRALPYVEVGDKALRDQFDRLLIVRAEVDDDLVKGNSVLSG